LKAVEKDRNTVMVCSATGNPEPSILWLKDYIPVDLSDPRIKLLHTGQCALGDWLRRGADFTHSRHCNKILFDQ